MLLAMFGRSFYVNGAFLCTLLENTLSEVFDASPLPLCVTFSWVDVLLKMLFDPHPVVHWRIDLPEDAGQQNGRNVGNLK